MKLSQIAAKPQLIEVTLDDAETVAEFGEPLTFHTWDRHPLDVFMRMAQATEQNTTQLITLARSLILDEHGKEIIGDDSMLPTSVMIRVITKVTEMLGK